MKRIFQAVNQDLGYKVEPYEILEWAGRALEQCQVRQAMKQYVALAKVENHTTKLPSTLTYIGQIARNNCYESSPACAADIMQIEPEKVTTQDNPALLDCQGNLIDGCDYAYYRPFVSWEFAFTGAAPRRLFEQCWTPVRPANHSFFLNVICSTRDEGLYDGCIDEYGLNDRDLILSFEEGQVAIAYFGPHLDEEGFPTFPDHESYVQAILSDIRYKMCYREYDMEEDRLRMGHVRQKLKDAEQDWHWYCQQAKNLGMLNGGGDDLMKDIQSIGDYILPPKNRYENFFGPLTLQQNRPRVLGGEWTRQT